MFERLTMPAHIKQALNKAVSEKKISHAYLFYGGDEQTVEKAAREFAAACICTNAQAPCGQCVHCQKAAQEAHADIISLRSGETSIKISHIRQMQYETSLMPYEAEKKVYIVHQADTMQKPAQNSLLKLLEEPNDYAIIILLAQTKNNFYPTVLSRCQVYDFGAGAVDEEIRQLAVSFFEAVLQGDIQDSLAAASQLARADLLQAAACIVMFLRDALLYQAQAGSTDALLVNGAHTALIAKLAQRYESDRLQQALDFVLDMRLTTSTNSQLFMQAMYCLLHTDRRKHAKGSRD